MILFTKTLARPDLHPLYPRTLGASSALPTVFIKSENSVGYCYDLLHMAPAEKKNINIIGRIMRFKDIFCYSMFCSRHNIYLDQAILEIM